MDSKRRGAIAFQVAELRYQKRLVKSNSGIGERAFQASLLVAALVLVVFVALKPPPFKECVTINSASCACPKSFEDIKRRSLILIDTTDPLRKGKYADIELLISSFAGGRKPFWDWIADGKGADLTSVFLLGAEAPPDMKPIATFCSVPPSVAMLASDFKGHQLRQLEEKEKIELRQIVEKAVSATDGASQSPIIEALSAVTGNASNWTPGGNLILVSDLIQNTAECGQWESPSIAAIPKFSSIPKACRPFVENLQEKLRPTKSYPEPSVVALCTLPGKRHKEGLLTFWKALFQEALNYDVLLSCDPQEVNERRRGLSTRSGNAAEKGGR